LYQAAKRGRQDSARVWIATRQAANAAHRQNEPNTYRPRTAGWGGCVKKQQFARVVFMT
jgi:hypothetical protein